MAAYEEWLPNILHKMLISWTEKKVNTSMEKLIIMFNMTNDGI